MSAPVKVGINGFGRIGRLVLRVLEDKYKGVVEVVAINDLYPPSILSHYLEFDSIYRDYPGEISWNESVERDKGAISIDRRNIAVLNYRNPSEIPWYKFGVDIVIEASGFFTDANLARGHIDGGGAKKVLISAPAKNEDITIVLGVNDHLLRPEHNIISNASCTTNGLSPLALVLEQTFGIEAGILTTIHSKTGSQSLTDSPKNDLRDGRDGSANIVPADTGAAKAVEIVIPSLKGKFTGIAFRVPTPTVSVIDFTAYLKVETSAGDIREAMLTAANGPLQGILGVTDKKLVSSDFIGCDLSSVFSSADTKVVGRMVKIISWYDNEWGYATRLADATVRVSKLQGY
ncbi:type I glyceraldehyde-3-phosphate dehydrogenase [Candidatus Curtissbacteria bacterium]|nr:type I glyceraldehyde-3-phosphate dehydrogenase [Candidatus Curtissbacteria bacterium]